ncbi:MAG: hypothetical protein GY825_11815, partial [Phycisphaeraceae bacterium]|nr:hypothetical protein [Phycisphaeraceae bacterium]
GLQSLGAIMAIGSLACMMASVVLLPGLLAMRRTRGHATDPAPPGGTP